MKRMNYFNKSFNYNSKLFSPFNRYTIYHFSYKPDFCNKMKSVTPIINYSKGNFSRHDKIANQDIKKRLKDKWEKKHGLIGMPSFLSNKNVTMVNIYPDFRMMNL